MKETPRSSVSAAWQALAVETTARTEIKDITQDVARLVARLFEQASFPCRDHQVFFL